MHFSRQFKLSGGIIRVPYEMIKKVKCSFYLETFPKRPCEMIRFNFHKEERKINVYIFPNIEKLLVSLQNSAELKEFKRQTLLLLEFQKKYNSQLTAVCQLWPPRFWMLCVLKPSQSTRECLAEGEVWVAKGVLWWKKDHMLSVSERVTPKSHTGGGPNFSYLWVSRAE